MTRAEIRRHALAIAEMRKPGRSRATSRRYAHGSGTPNDFDPNKRRVYERTFGDEIGSVDTVMRHRMTSGHLPKGSWS